MARANPPLQRVFLDCWTTTTVWPQPQRLTLPGLAKTWADVAAMIGDHAQETYRRCFDGQGHTYTHLRALCLERFLTEQGQDRTWTLTEQNTTDSPEGFVVNIRVGSGLHTRD